MKSIHAMKTTVPTLRSFLQFQKVPGGRFLVSVLFVVLCGGMVQAEKVDSSRKVVSLDGAWEIAEGKLDAMPAQFSRKIPVPGLVDMADPPFEKAEFNGKEKASDSPREAFWYHRTFSVDGPLPDVAILKIGKARYGTKVFLNGQPVGEHLPCFTPGYFDLRKYLKGNGEPNELVVRIGATHFALPKELPWGWDAEKHSYLAGIYDSVELVLTGSPFVIRVQAVPDITAKTVRAVALVRNAGTSPVDTKVRCTVHEAKTGKEAGTAESKAVHLAPGEEKTVDLNVPVENCRLWSPEDPFLYELTAKTDHDSMTTRFGMRSFRLDEKTKLAVLNGKPYFLRGTNICIDRFTEDPHRGDKPWREDWVRSVIRSFKDMHWNSARYCIGFPPEIWYRIADEEGFLVQDEFPIWRNNIGTEEAMKEQYREWMEERWNHPCVVIWDAQNETPHVTSTGNAIQSVRHLDLSNRPWDNGWSSPMSPTDVYEAHPYRFNNPKFHLSMFANESPKPDFPDNSDKPNRPAPNTGDNPIIVNEYGWAWLNRDGSPTLLSVKQKVYERLLPEGAKSPDDYRRAYARALAAKTEFWRAGRKLAGLMHFCGLGMSRPDTATSDNYIEIEKPTFEPFFYKYVRDAFAPVGLMINAWAESYPAGKNQDFPVVVINDLYQDWKGTVRFRLLSGDKVVCEKTGTAAVPALGKITVPFSVGIPSENGNYTAEATLVGTPDGDVQSLRDFKVTNPTENKQ